MATLPARQQPTVDAIYEAYERDAETGFRYHLGASLIGKECDRALWFDFRWITRAKFAGRMLRLFQTGHMAESRFVADLRRAGVEVYDHEFLDPARYAEDYDKPAKQISVRDDFGHFGGSLDGVGIGFIEAPKAWHVIEMKTHSEKSFKLLEKDGVQKAKPQHFAQMQIYMHFMGLDRAYYLAVNKNTDHLHSERIHYDATFAIQLAARANRIIQSPRPPARISNDPAWFQCRFCDHAPTCHEGKLPERNCRTCLHSTPVEGGKWHCAVWTHDLTREEQEAGCSDHRYVPDLVAGEQIDATHLGVTYAMRDGSEWTDGPVEVEF